MSTVTGAFYKMYYVHHTSQSQKIKNLDSDQGKKTWRFGRKPGDLSMASKRTKTKCREHIKMKMDC